MADREPDEVRTEALRVIVLTQDGVISRVYQFDLNDDCLDSQVLQLDNEWQRCLCRTGVPARMLASLSRLSSRFLEVNLCECPGIHDAFISNERSPICVLTG